MKLTDGTQDIVIGTNNGLAIRFRESEIRAMGRTAAGVRGIRLGKNDKVIGAVNLRRKGTTILVATEKGFGKRSEEEEYRISHRGGKGIITVKISDKTGKMVAIKEVVDTDDVVVVTTSGMIIRQHAADIRVAGRNTQGVHLIRLKEGDSIADVAAVVAEEEEEKQLIEQENKPPAEKKENFEHSPIQPNDGKSDVKQNSSRTQKSRKKESLKKQSTKKKFEKWKRKKKK